MYFVLSHYKNKVRPFVLPCFREVRTKTRKYLQKIPSPIVDTEVTEPPYCRGNKQAGTVKISLVTSIVQAPHKLLIFFYDIWKGENLKK